MSLLHLPHWEKVSPCIQLELYYQFMSTVPPSSTGKSLAPSPQGPPTGTGAGVSSPQKLSLLQDEQAQLVAVFLLMEGQELDAV